MLYPNTSRCFVACRVGSAKKKTVVQYAQDTSRLPTFVVYGRGAVTGFIILRQHFPRSYEIHCLAVESQSWGKGYGRALIEHAEAWAVAEGGQFLQVKTIAAVVQSPEYAETREFYKSMGFVPLELFPTLWSEVHPCLQLIKCIADGR